jgi:hypothetical protein
MSDNDPHSNIEAFRQFKNFKLEWRNGTREISVLTSNQDEEITPEVLATLTLGDVWKRIRKGYLTDNDSVSVLEWEFKRLGGGTIYKYSPSLTLSEVRAQIRLLRP